MLQVVADLHEELWCSASSKGDSCVMSGVTNVFIRLSSLFACCNSAINFFIYYASLDFSWPRFCHENGFYKVEILHQTK